MTALTALVVGLLAGFKLGAVPKAFRVTVSAIAIVLIFQTIMLATVDKGRAFEGDGAWSYWVVQAGIFIGGLAATWLGAKIHSRSIRT